MDILLHLGAHRCASTTFQAYLWRNRIKLAKQGLTCWTPKRTRDGLMCGLIRNPAMISVQDEQKAIRSIGRMRVEMARLRNNGQKALLISDENILGSMRNNVLDKRLYALLCERLMRFRPAFEGQKLTVALSIRSYEDFWTSSLLYLVGQGRSLPDVDLLDFLTTQPRRWRSVVRDIATVFPQADIVVWPFERMADRPEAQLRAMWPQNFRGLEIGDIWRNRGADRATLNETLELRGETLVEAGLDDADARWTPFDDEQSKMLRAEYRRDLAWFRSGAEGLARFVEGRSAPGPNIPTGDDLNAIGQPTKIGSGRSTSAPRPDRAELTRTAQNVAAHFGGQQDEREKGGVA